MRLRSFTLGDLAVELRDRGCTIVAHGKRQAWLVPGGGKIPCRVGHNTTKDMVMASELRVANERLVQAGLPPIGWERERPGTIWAALVRRWRRALSFFDS